MSRPLFVVHSSPVTGWKTSPTALRIPRAKTRAPLPSGAICRIAARRSSASSQTLQDEPTDTYSIPSGPNPSVRVEWPPPDGRSARASRPSKRPSPSVSVRRETWFVSPTYSAPSRKTIPCGAFRPSATTSAPSAWPSPFRSGTRTISPRRISVAYSSPSGPSVMKRTPVKSRAYAWMRKPAGSRRDCSRSARVAAITRGRAPRRRRGDRRVADEWRTWSQPGAGRPRSMRGRAGMDYGLLGAAGRRLPPTQALGPWRELGCKIGSGRLSPRLGSLAVGHTEDGSRRDGPPRLAGCVGAARNGIGLGVAIEDVGVGGRRQPALGRPRRCPVVTRV